MKPFAVLATKILITTGALFWIGYGLDFGAFVRGWAVVEGRWVMLALLLQFLALGAGMLRWWTLCNISTNQRIPLRKISGAYFLGLFFNQFLPTSIGGDASRTFAIYRAGYPGKELVSAGIMDRLLGIISLITVALTSAYVHHGFPILEGLERTILGFGLVLIAGFLVITSRHGRAIIHKLLNAVTFTGALSVVRDILTISISFGKSPRTLILCYLLSISLQMLVILAYMSIGASISVSQSFLDYAIVISIVYVVASLPISLGGLGIREGTFVALFVLLGVDKEMATTLSLMYLVVLWTSSLPGVVVFLKSRQLLRHESAVATH